MISPLSATAQKHRQAFDIYTHTHTQSITLIKQGTKPRMDMVQCKTTNMIEILKLNTETDVCVLPLCLCQLFTAERPDGKRSQPAFPVHTSTSSLIGINTLSDLNTCESPLSSFALCFGQGFVGICSCLCVFQTLVFHPALIRSVIMETGSNHSCCLIRSESV